MSEPIIESLNIGASAPARIHRLNEVLRLLKRDTPDLTTRRFKPANGAGQVRRIAIVWCAIAADDAMNYEVAKLAQDKRLVAKRARGPGVFR